MPSHAAGRRPRSPPTCRRVACLSQFDHHRNGKREKDGQQDTDEETETERKGDGRCCPCRGRMPETGTATFSDAGKGRGPRGHFLKVTPVESPKMEAPEEDRPGRVTGTGATGAYRRQRGAGRARRGLGRPRKRPAHPTSSPPSRPAPRAGSVTASSEPPCRPVPPSPHLCHRPPDAAAPPVAKPALQIETTALCRGGRRKTGQTWAALHKTGLHPRLISGHGGG